MLSERDVRIERITGTGPGGQHRNRTASCIRATHVPSGISVTIDGRHQHRNLAVAMRELERRLELEKLRKKAAVKKSHRDAAIKDTHVVRTYDYKSSQVRDHRTGKRAPLSAILFKGRLDLLR